MSLPFNEAAAASPSYSSPRASGSGSGGGNKNQETRAKRSRSGCLTCRLRKKRCDEARPICAMCKRLGLECLGVDAQRPEWMRKKEVVSEVTARMKKSIAESNAAKMSQYWLAKAAASGRLAASTTQSPEDDRMDQAMCSQENEDGYMAHTNEDGGDSNHVNDLTVENLAAAQASSSSYNPVRWDQTSLTQELTDLLTYPIPQAQMVDDSDLNHDSPQARHSNSPMMRFAPGLRDQVANNVRTGIGSSTSYNNNSGTLSTQSSTPYTPWPPYNSAHPSVDPDLLTILGFQYPYSSSNQVSALNQPIIQSQPPSYFPLLPQPSTDYGVTFRSNTTGPGQSADMRYFHHYLSVIMPYQWIFERQVMSDLVAPLAFTNPNVFESLTALAALHMGAKRRRSHQLASSVTTSYPFQPQSTATIKSLSNDEGICSDAEDPDLLFAETSLKKNVQMLKRVSFNDFGSQDMIVAAMAASSFHLFDGGNRKGWKEAVDLCRRCLAAILRNPQSWSGSNLGSKLDVAAMLKKLGHLLSPLVWTDILTSVTEGVASEFLSLYRTLLLDDQTEGETGKLLRETVMGCDSTTRLAIAETIALSEWKDKAARMGQLSIRDLMERVTSIERLLGERRWRERHLFETDDPTAVQRKAVSDVFFHGARVLLATTLNGPFPSVPEVSSAVQDTANALLAIDLLNLEGADRALVFPTVIAGCHTENPGLQQIFRNRFERLGEAAASFGNTRNALRLMERVWKRREMIKLPNDDLQGVHWRKVMFEVDEEGLLLI